MQKEVNLDHLGHFGESTVSLQPVRKLQFNGHEWMDIPLAYQLLLYYEMFVTTVVIKINTNSQITVVSSFLKRNVTAFYSFFDRFQ